MKKKPHWFRLVDAVFMAGPGLLTLAFVAYALTVGAEGPKDWVALCCVVSATFVGLWGAFVWQRKKWLDEFTWYPTYGFMVHPGKEGYALPSPNEFDSLVSGVVQAWSPYYSIDRIFKEDVFWCFFKKDLNETPKNPAKMKVKGLSIAYSHTMMVDFDKTDDPIDKTAFAHELGHLIMGHATGDWDLERHHAFMAKHALR